MPSLDDIGWPVRTERLTLRRGRADDADVLFATRSDPDVARWLTSWPRDREDFRRMLAETPWLETMVVVERDGQVIGDMLIRVGDAWAQAEAADRAIATQAELGYTFSPAWTGQGYAAEAARAALEICFDRLGLRRVVALAFADNTASRRLMERLGMRLEAVNLRDSYHRDLGWLDGVAYAILAEEWRAGGH